MSLFIVVCLERIFRCLKLEIEHNASHYRADAKLEVFLGIHIPHFNFNSYYYTN